MLQVRGKECALARQSLTYLKVFYILGLGYAVDKGKSSYIQIETNN